MNKHKGAVAAAAAFTALALPASAGAHADVSPASVAKHVRNADQALDMVETLVAQNRDGAAAVAFARNQRQSTVAGRESARLLRQADDRRERAKAARAIKKVAGQQNRNVETYAEVVDEVGGGLQLAVAEAVESGLRGRELALEILTRLSDRVPPQAQVGISRAIAALSSDGRDESVDIAQALASGELSASAEQALTDALELATAAMDQAVERLRSLLGEVPAEARPYVEQALNRVVAQLEQVKQTLSDVLGSFPF